MAQILSLDLARQAKHINQSTFRQLVSEQLRADLDRKRLLLHSLGNQSAVIREIRAEADRGGDHIMILFAGAGQLKGYSFSFVVRDVPQHDALRAEIWVVSNTATDLFSKTLCEIQTGNYSRRWLNECYAAAMDHLVPTTAQSSSAGAVRA